MRPTLSRRLSLDREAIQSPNLCDRLSEDDLAALGRWVWEGFEKDQNSRRDWLRRNAAGMDLAMQVVKDKSFPWPDCSNVAFPLVTIATLQFHSRAYPALVQAPELVQMRVVGGDPQGTLAEQARRVGCHMSYQLLEENPAWEEQHDRLLINVPIVGCAFKKTYYSAERGHNLSELVLAKDLVIDYFAKDISSASRKTHILSRHRNDIWEAVQMGRFRDILSEAWYSMPARTLDESKEVDRRDSLKESEPDDATPFTLLEQHCSFDLDGDGYFEPYTITIESGSRAVLRIVARVDREEDVDRRPSGRIVRIRPTEHFTKYGFIPSPDGSIYDLGFGLLLGPLNEAVNTNVNQLLDAGTMANSAGGFLGRGAKIRGGVYTFAPLEWKRVDSTGDDLRKNIFPLPVRDPSPVLFNLLSLLIQYTDRISGATEIRMGENVGQNTKVGTVEAMIEQGGMVYAAIFKRIWRSMKEEFSKLYQLNAANLDAVVSYGVGKVVGREDYLGDPGQIRPAADPNVVSDSVRLLQANLLAERAMAVPGYDRKLVEHNLLRAMKIEGYEAFYPGEEVTGSPKDPKVAVAELSAQIKSAEMEQEQAQFIEKMLEEQRVNSAQIALILAKAEEAAANAGSERGWQALEGIQMLLTAAKQRDEAMNARLKVAVDAMKAKNDARKAKTSSE